MILAKKTSTIFSPNEAKERRGTRVFVPSNVRTRICVTTTGQRGELLVVLSSESPSGSVQTLTLPEDSL